jgi:Family of unknown function (DUF6444)
MPLDAARDAVIAVQALVIEALVAENAQLARQVADLAARLERLERLASRNSGNSSMPPSADDLPGPTPPRGKQAGRGGKRKPGKQPGAPGSHLAWSEHPDDTVPHSRPGRANAAPPWPVPRIGGGGLVSAGGDPAGIRAGDPA